MLRAAVLERVEAAIEPLGEIRNRAAEVAERPADLREALRHAGEHQRRRGQRRVEQEADERHQPVLLHRLDADRIRRMDVEHGADSFAAS